MKKLLKIALIGVAVLFGLGVVGILFSDEPEPVTEEAPKVEAPDTNKDETPSEEEMDAMLKEMIENAPEPKVTRDEWEYLVEYTITNDTGYNFDYIEVEYDVFDANGVKLSHDFQNISMVMDGQTFKITLDLYQDGAETYKITSINSSAW